MVAKSATQTDEPEASSESPTEGKDLTKEGSNFDWAPMTKDNAYLFYLRDWRAAERGDKKTERVKGKGEIVVSLRSPLTLLAVLFFAPLFSAEFFFAISRQFMCTGAEWGAEFCQAYTGP